ncbi:MocR-like pyridoxine biosynthesis transcription factor PdxR [Longirhabdus pacifica]|uniref:MocR-like pyridoxine biosynthesis transcription factor PdxR n=1 Tax=Longirhabdus pacifica TaxID=2305227 RepID=UPI001008911B|nr:PLP-dependent aminotransferase family protein [Longirhabdus pacifica]
MPLFIPLEAYKKRYTYKYKALYHALHDAITSGHIPNHTKLPSTRALAKQYQLSRGIVNQVYEMLTAEGYIFSEVGKGSYVTFTALTSPVECTEKKPDIPLSKWGQQLSKFDHTLVHTLVDAKENTLHFHVGTPDQRHFPKALWSRSLYQSVRETIDHPHYDLYDTQGNLALREAICQHVRHHRGIHCTPEEIVLVNGSMQAIAILAQLLLDAEDHVMIENPCYSGILNAIATTGASPIPLPVDQDGVVFEPHPSKMLFTTPSRQYPTGSVLSLKRRQHMLHWANEQHAYIVEDDYDSEFRYKGKPIEPLKVLDQEQRVIYIGTFTKTMMTALRIGYVILPPSLVQAFITGKKLFEPHPSNGLEQRALAHFMKTGHYDRHIRKMTRVYKSKQTYFFHLLSTYCRTWFSFHASDSGLHVFAEWKGSEEAYEKAKTYSLQQGISWTDCTSYYYHHPVPSACFGFSHLDLEHMEKHVKRLSNTLAKATR